MSTKIKETLTDVVVGILLFFACIMVIGIIVIICVFFTNLKDLKETPRELEICDVTNHEFIEIEAWDENDLTGLAYDSKTKIIYMFTTVNGVRIYEPYYVMNGDNEPIIGVIHDDIEY